MKKKLKLDELSVKSFITEMGEDRLREEELMELKGGSVGQTVFPTCQDNWFCDVLNWSDDCSGERGCGGSSIP